MYFYNWHLYIKINVNLYIFSINKKRYTYKQNKYKLIKFEDCDFSLDVNVSPNEETVWLNRIELSMLFERDIKTISKHINNALQEECKNSTVAKIATVQLEGKTLWIKVTKLKQLKKITK